MSRFPRPSASNKTLAAASCALPSYGRTYYYTVVIARWISRSRPVVALVVALAMTGCSRGSRPNLVGHSAPDFAVQDSDRRVELKQLSGKIIVLNFWATWCPPCVEEMPSLGAMQSQMQPRGVQVLAVSIDEDGAAYHRFLQEHNIRFLTVRDPAQSSSALYGTRGWPETYIIDRRGIVRRKFIGPINWTDPEILEYLQTL